MATCQHRGDDEELPETGSWKKRLSPLKWERGGQLSLLFSSLSHSGVPQPRENLGMTSNLTKWGRKLLQSTSPQEVSCRLPDWLPWNLPAALPLSQAMHSFATSKLRRSSENKKAFALELVNPQVLKEPATFSLPGREGPKTLHYFLSPPPQALGAPLAF